MDNYGTITLEQVVELEKEYIDEEGRLAQDSYMLYKCLMVSLTNDKAKKKVQFGQINTGLQQQASQCCGAAQSHHQSDAP
jgi:hypothetical protein